MTEFYRRLFPDDEFDPDDGEYYIEIPFSDIRGKRGWFVEGKDDLYIEADEALGHWRLQHIRQLSLLGYVGYDKDLVYSIPFQHNRIVHSLQTARLSESIAQNNNLPQNDIDTLIIASLLHDIATPALGDATKKVDPVNLDEETYWYEMLDKKGRDFLSSKGFSPQRLDEIIHNQNYLGSILDVADKISYTLEDAKQIIGELPPARSDITMIQFPDLELIDACLKTSGMELGNIYKDVKIDTLREGVYFINPDRLYLLLMLRTGLFHGLYMNPYDMGRDFLFEKIIRKFYAPDGSRPLSPGVLRQMVDDQLLEMLSQKMGLPPTFDMSIINWSPEYEKFKTFQEAHRRVVELEKDLSNFVLGVKECKGFNPNTTLPVQASNPNRIYPYREIFPEEAGWIEALEEDTHGFMVYYEPSADSDRTKIRLIIDFLKAP